MTDTIQHLIESWQADTLPKPDLYRGLMAHPTWTVAGHRDGARLSLGVLKPERAPDSRILEVFSSPTAIETFETSSEETLSPKRVTLSGQELFGALGDDMVDRLNIDPLSNHTCHFLAQQIPMLRQWARIVELELALMTPGRASDPVGLLSRYDNFHTIVVPDDDGTFDVVLAPDSGGRALAAIFTSEDLAQAFVDRVEMDDEPAIWRQSAGELFGQLRVMAVAGMVFNPLTPLKPVALSAALTDEILDRIRTNP